MATNNGVDNAVLSMRYVLRLIRETDSPASAYAVAACVQQMMGRIVAVSAEIINAPVPNLPSLEVDALQLLKRDDVIALLQVALSDEDIDEYTQGLHQAFTKIKEGMVDS